MKRLWPAVVALVALVIVYFVMRSHHDEVAHETPVANQGTPPAMPPPGPPPSVPPPVGQGSDVQGSEGHAPGDVDDQGSAPSYGSSTPHEAEDAPPVGAKKPKLTLDEKLVETAKHIEVMKKRGQLLAKEIADLQKAGKAKEAQEQQVVLDRLNEHMKKLQTAIDEHKEPM